MPGATAGRQAAGTGESQEGETTYQAGRERGWGRRDGGEDGGRVGEAEFGSQSATAIYLTVGSL